MKSFKDFVGIKVVTEANKGEEKFISSLLNAFNRFLKSSDNPYGKVATFEDESEFKEYLYKYYDGDMLEEQFMNLDLDKYFKKSGKVHKYLHLHSDVPSYSLQDDTKKAIIEMFSHNDWYRTFSDAVNESLSYDKITEVENYFKVEDIADINEIKLLDYLLKTHLTDMFDVKKIY